MRAFGMDPAAHVRVTNPIASDQALVAASPGARDLAKHRGERQAPRELTGFLKSGWKFRQAGGGLARRRAPHLVDGPRLRTVGRWRCGTVRDQAGPPMPDARESKPTPPPPFLYEHPARTDGDGVEGPSAIGRLFELHPSLIETGRAALLDLDIGRCAVAGSRRNEVHADSTISFERIRFVRHRRRPPVRGGSYSRARRRFAGSAAGVDSICAAVRRAPARPGPQERVVSAHRSSAPRSGRCPPKRSGQIRERIIDGMRQLGYELRVVSTRRTSPGGWVKRRRMPCRWCGGEVPKRPLSPFAARPCVHEWKLRTDAGYLRAAGIRARSRRMCAMREVTPEALRKDQAQTRLRRAPAIRKRVGRAGKNLWDADHIVPVVEGGGECDSVQHADALPEVSPGSHRRLVAAEAVFLIRWQGTKPPKIAF